MSSRCRSKTFYLAPGVYRTFAEYSVKAVLSDGTLQKITHRRGIRALQKEHPEWDGMCIVTPKNPDGSVTEGGEYGELWRLDERLIEGRRPQNDTHVITKIAHKSLNGVGGFEAVNTLIENRETALVVWDYVKTLQYSTNQAQSLRFLTQATKLLTHKQTAILLQHMRSYDTGLSNVVVYPHGLSFQALGRLDQKSRLQVLKNVWTVHQTRCTENVAVLLGACVFQNHPWWQTVQTRLNEKNPAWIRGFANYYLDYYGPTHPLETLDLYPQTLQELARVERGVIHVAATHRNTTPELIDRLFGSLSLQTVEMPLATKKLNKEAAKALKTQLQKAPLHRTDNALLAGNYAKLAYTLVNSCPDEETDEIFKKAMKSWFVASRNAWQNGDVATRGFDKSVLQLKDSTRSAVWQWALELEKHHKHAEEKAKHDPRQTMPPYVKLDGLKVALGLAPQQPALWEVYRSTPRDERGALLRGEAENYRKNPSRFNDFVNKMRDELSAEECRQIRDELGNLLPPSVRNIAEIKHYVETNNPKHLLRHENGRGAVSSIQVLAEVGMRGEVPENLLEVLSKDYFMDADHYAGLAMLGYDKPVEPGWGKDDPLTASAWRVTEALLADEETWPQNARELDDLPERNETPWELDQKLVASMEGKTLTSPSHGELEVHVISQAKELRENANKLMKNCTAGYAGAIQQGTDLILALNRDGRPVLNVNVTKRENGWMVGEVNSYANSGVPEATRQAVEKNIKTWLIENGLPAA